MADLKKKHNSVATHTWVILITSNVLAFLVFVIVNLFVVDTVIIDNNELYQASTIKDAVLNDDMSWSTLYVYLKYKFTDPDIPYVDSVEVKMQDPTTLEVTVYEKSILGKFYLSRKKEYIYFDTDGIVTEISAREVENVPEIKGLECEKATLYQPLSISSTSLHDLLNLTTTLRRSDLIPETILYGGNNGPILQYANGVEVVVGTNDSLTQKIERMAAIMPMITQAGTLHLENWSEETTDIVFEKGILASASVKETTQNATVTKESSDSTEKNTGEDTADKTTTQTTGTAGTTGETRGEGTADEVDDGTVDDGTTGTGTTDTTGEGTANYGEADYSGTVSQDQ